VVSISTTRLEIDFVWDAFAPAPCPDSEWGRMSRNVPGCDCFRLREGQSTTRHFSHSLHQPQTTIQQWDAVAAHLRVDVGEYCFWETEGGEGRGRRRGGQGAEVERVATAAWPTFLATRQQARDASLPPRRPAAGLLRLGRYRGGRRRRWSSLVSMHVRPSSHTGQHRPGAC
jgi:hypothetical protein